MLRLAFAIALLATVATSAPASVVDPRNGISPTPGLSLSVSPGGPQTLLYTVARDGHIAGGGRITLVDDNSTWMDLPWGGDPNDGAELVYVKAPSGGRP